MNLVLTRDIYEPTHTNGWLFAGDHKFATVERGQIPNPKGPGGMPRISCIDEGEYTLKPHDSDKFPGTYALINTQRGVYYQPDDIPAGQGWGRSAILLHSGNSSADVIGCIAIGMERDADGVARSREALAALRLMLGRTENHRLSIINGAK